MKMIMIKVSEAKQSATNVKGRNYGKSFDDLVASVKEKGILQPILVRPLNGKDKIGKYEVIAGNRRLAAAKAAGIEEIPAQLVEMNDVEAREAQIVENLQRQDIHPLDEGKQYRDLIEKSSPRYGTNDVAIKVGKTENYVRQRLALTNLCAKAEAKVRDGKMSLGNAILLSRLDGVQQEKVMKATYDNIETDRLHDKIEEIVYRDLSGKPWAKDAKLAEMVGDMSAKPENLFGDKELGNDPVIVAKQMAAFIEIKLREAQSKGEKMVRISTAWGTPGIKGVLAKDNYRVVSKSDKDVKNVVKGIVVEGDDRGRIFTITTDKESIKGSTVYKPTAAEKAKRKKEIEKEKEREAKKISDFQEAINKVKFPISEKQLNALLDFALYSRGVSIQQPVTKLLGAEIVKVEEKDYDDKKVMRTSYRESLLKYADENGNDGKIRVIFALMIPHPSSGEHDDSNSKDFKEAAKKL